MCGTLVKRELPQMLLQAYMQGLDADASSNDLIDKRTEAEKELSSEQIDAVMTQLYGVGRSKLAVNGHVSASSAPQPMFVLNVSLTFPKVGSANCKRWIGCDA
jgi:hypothetical protein